MIAVARRLCLLLSVALLTTGCSVERKDPTTPQRSGVLDPHGLRPLAGGLGVDPADGSLVVAGNRGLFRSRAAGDGSWQRIDARLDTPAGSTLLKPPFIVDVTGPGRLIGTARGDLVGKGPSQPGLLESGDAGRTWRRLPGARTVTEVRALQASGTWVYALAQGRNTSSVHVSSDGGRTFENQIGPEGLPVDLAVDPAFPSVAVAVTTRGLWLSSSAGRSWRELAPRVFPGSRQAERGVMDPRLVWTAETGLIMVDEDGRIRRSRDQAASFVSIGRFDGDPEAVAVDTDGDLLILVSDGTLVRHDLGARVRRP